MRRINYILLGVVVLAALLVGVVFADYSTSYHTGSQIYYDDDCDIFFGTDLDFSIYSDTAGIFEFDPLTAGNEIRFGTSDTDAVDMTWYGDTSGATVAWDEENCEVLYSKTVLQLDDDSSLYIGSAESTDATLTWDNTNAELDVTVPVGSIHLTCSAVPDGQYGLEVEGAIAGGTASQGSAAYFHTSITGNIDDPTYNLGSWLDITDGTPTSGALFVAVEAGVYVSATPTMTAADIAVIQAQYMGNSSSTCRNVAMMRFNSLLSGQGGEAPDWFIQAGNDESICLTLNSTHQSASNAKVGAIKIYSAQSGTMYIYCYSDAGS